MASQKTIRKTSRKPAVVENAMVEETVIETGPRPKQNSPFLMVIPILIALLALVIWKNKAWVVAATVNNQPIWRWDLEGRLDNRYGSQTLDEMVNEQILKNEAAKQGVTVTDADVNAKISEIEKSLQGKITLKDALAQQGMTMDDFHHQVEIQVLIQKLTANKVTVSDKEIADYIAANKDSLTATDEAGMNDEARTAIEQQKSSQQFQTIFAALKKNAKVTKFL